MYVALLAISYFGTLFLLSSNIVLPVKSLITIILVVWELHFVVQNCGEWRFGRGKGEWMHRFLYFLCSPKVIVPCSNSI